MKINVYTLGCRLNQCESEAVAKAFSDAGFEVSNDNDCDFFIVNTCTVTSKAEQKARRMIRLFAEQAPVLVTGCYAQMNSEDIKSLAGNVCVLPLVRKQELLSLPHYFKKNVLLNVPLNEHTDKVEILRLLDSFCKKNADENTSSFDFNADNFNFHTRSYLKIQDGCDNSCSFCRVHIARGENRFLDEKSVIERALKIQNNGYREIVLTGVNITMYDNKGRGLGGLVKSLLSNLGEDIRIRLSSLEPDNINDFLLEQLGDRRIQPYFHISVQSASDKVLSRINRNCSLEHLCYVVDELKKVKEDPFLSCDIITGLPSEDEKAFEQTYSFIEKKGFASLHIFPFSPRPDTVLFNARDKVPESVRDKRAGILRELSDRLNAKYLMRQIGKQNEVILENRENGFWNGLSGNYMHLKIENVPAFARTGALIPVTVKTADTAVAL